MAGAEPTAPTINPLLRWRPLGAQMLQTETLAWPMCSGRMAVMWTRWAQPRHCGLLVPPVRLHCCGQRPTPPRGPALGFGAHRYTHVEQFSRAARPWIRRPHSSATQGDVRRCGRPPGVHGTGDGSPSAVSHTYGGRRRAARLQVRRGSGKSPSSIPAGQEAHVAGSFAHIAEHSKLCHRSSSTMGAG